MPLVTPPGAVLDPMVALATSVHASPGVYALLLGSGVSTGAGVLTGWQVVTDLVRKVAAAQAPDDLAAAGEVGDEPEAWWAEHGDGQPLGYSRLLGELASTPAARQALLAGYFEPSEADREQGLKMPSAAHRAIAQLVARGAVRVILTTNFDRLTERALEDAGVPPQVLHRPDQLASATALAHAKVTVIKLHGDYADLEQRNTADELAEYPEALAAYLGRVLDEYGLIVSGWSAEWDTALVRALEETRSRRYPLFWSSRGTIKEDARRLIAQHGAVSMPGLTADDLFTGLAAGWTIEALESEAYEGEARPRRPGSFPSRPGRGHSAAQGSVRDGELRHPGAHVAHWHARCAGGPEVPRPSRDVPDRRGSRPHQRSRRSSVRPRTGGGRTQLARGRVNALTRADLGRILAAPSVHTLGTLARASGHDVLLAHQEAYDRTGTGTIHGNRSSVSRPARSRPTALSSSWRYSIRPSRQKG